MLVWFSVSVLICSLKADKKISLTENPSAKVMILKASLVNPTKTIMITVAQIKCFLEKSKRALIIGISRMAAFTSSRFCVFCSSIIWRSEGGGPFLMRFFWKLFMALVMLPQNFLYGEVSFVHFLFRNL